MLLDDIIELATDDRKAVTSLLRKCLVLGHRLKNQRLTVWSNQELNGYSSDDDLPDYRVISAGAKAYLSGPFGASINNFPVPSVLLREEHRHFATHVRLTEAISVYEELMRSDGDEFRVEWPADLNFLYQRTISTESGCYLAQAWQTVGKGAIAKVLDSVRNRTLNLALEIRPSIGGDSELDSISPQKAAKVDRSVTNNIYGGVNVISSGESKVNSTISDVQNVISVGNEAQLKTALRSAGLSESNLSELSNAIEQDVPKRFGSHVKKWVKENAPRALVGGVKVGTTIAQSVLSEYLKQYWGI